MTVTRVSVGEKVRAAKINAIIDEVNLSGSLGVIPTSVAGSGVSFDSTTGVITFSSATTVNINGVFSSAYRNYQIVFDATGTAATIAMTLRASGTDSIVNYDLTENLARNATVSSSTALNAASWAISGATGGNTTHAATIDVFVPFVTRETRILSTVGTHANPAASSIANALKIGYGTHRLKSAYDGFSLAFSAAQSGTLRVYGR